MLSLLIVDDEPIIVDVLYRLLASLSELELEVTRAYSVDEALDAVRQRRYDLVLSDIRMPGRNGLELQKEIQSVWPRCRFIFLTGYSDSEYLKQAIENGTAGFLYKTEHESKIAETVAKTVEAIREERRDEQLVERSKRNLQLALPKLRETLLAQLLRGDPITGEALRRQFADLQMPISADERALLLAGRIDRWPGMLPSTDKALLAYAVQNIAEEFLTEGVRLVSIACDEHKLVWLIQPKQGLSVSDYRQAFAFVLGTMESVQDTCGELLKLSTSFVLSPEPAELRRTAEVYAWTSRIFSRGLGLEQGILTSGGDGGEAGVRLTEQSGRPFVKSLLKQLDRLDLYLSSGQRDEYFELFRQLIDPPGAEPDLRHPTGAELYYAFVTFFLGYTNRSGLTDWVASRWELDRLPRLDAHKQWSEAADYFFRLSELLFGQQSTERDEQSRELIRHVQQYVEEHLGDQLSLNRIAESVYLSPSYLSRLYKRVTGSKLSEYIAGRRLDRAQELLRRGELKIHEIAKELGFDSPAYFTHFFKKMTNRTPQEYRHTDAIGNGQ